MKKKKKKKTAASSRGLMIALYAGGGVLAIGLLVVVIWALANAAGGGPPAQPIVAWEKFLADEREFGFDYPAGWREKSYGLSGKRQVEIKSRNAAINVSENLTGSLIGDIANAATGGREVDDERLPVASVHELRKPKDSKTYKEERAVTVMTKFGKARKSAYADGSKRGYRATVLMNQTALDVFCECRDSDWETLRPAFDRVIESLGRGG